MVVTQELFIRTWKQEVPGSKCLEKTTQVHFFALRYEENMIFNKGNFFVDLNQDRFWRFLKTWSFVPNFYGKPSFVFMAGRFLIFFTLPINSENSDSFEIGVGDIVAQDYVTPCCGHDGYYLGHTAMLEGRLLMVDYGVKVSTIVARDLKSEKYQKNNSYPSK